MDTYMFTPEHQEDDLCNTIDTQDLLPFSASQSILLSESEGGLDYYSLPPLSGVELIKMESSFNLNTVLPVPKVENENKLFFGHPDPEHWHKFPTMEKVDSKYAFDMHIHPCENQNWLFNAQSNKVFIKLNSVMRLTFSYKPDSESEKLTLRAMILFSSSDDMHCEVKRCPNHRVTDYKGVPKEHMLRCCHPKTEYVGVESGQEFKDRLAIVVPLDERPSFDEDGYANESILLEFLCLNSCPTGINRKSTAVVFTLENERREIIGKKLLPFKVCSCPKRDMGREDIVNSRKRESSSVPQSVPPSKRPSKMSCTEVKNEPQTPTPETSNGFGYMSPQDVPDLAPFTFTLTMPDRDSTKHVLRCAFNEITGLMINPETDEETKLRCQEYSKSIKDLLVTHCG